MIKVMLVIDDYSEAMVLEGILKRTGFDVLSLNKDSAVSDTLLGFIPEIVIASYRGRNIDFQKVALKVKKPGSPSKLIALCPNAVVPEQPPEARFKFDGQIQVPIEAGELLTLVARLLKMDDDATLLKKYDKLTHARSVGDGTGLIIVKNEAREMNDDYSGPTVIGDPAKVEEVSRERKISARELKYDEFVKKITEPVDQVLSHEAMVRHIRDLRNDSKRDEYMLEEINEQKRQFLIAMMNKAQG